MATRVSPVGPRRQALEAWQVWMAALAEKHGEAYRVRAEGIRKQGIVKRGPRLPKGPKP